MADFLSNNLANIIIIAVLAVAAIFAIRSLVKSKRQGGACAGCSEAGSCGHSCGTRTQTGK